ncbi:MAG: ATP-dependent sacrificial sulfur transferase LarE [Methanobacteriota archaeon]
MPDQKLEKLEKLIKDQESAVIAFSGGVDSSVLAAVAFKVLKDKALAVTLDSPTLPRNELECARTIAKSIGIKHIVIAHDELGNPDFTMNPEDRCYFCKGELSKVLLAEAVNRGFKVVLEGTNASELCGHRPGARALSEAGVLSPLAEVGFSKEEVRTLAGTLGLPNASKPSSACLSSRIPYGDEITRKKLGVVEEAEDFLINLGLSQLRVRLHGDLARIEVDPPEFRLLFENRVKISDFFKSIGFKYVTCDLLGYRSGSMNE